MMWESPVIGTSIPRGCRGRATTINDHNRPVEIQTYRTPDPRKGTSADDQELLDRLRPTTVRHERLMILPPEGDCDADSGEGADPTYTDYASARWDLASKHADRDPVARRQGGSGGGGRELASPMTVFGLTAADTGAVATPGPVPVPEPAASGGWRHLSVVAAADDPAEYEDSVDSLGGYGPATACPVGRVTVGDLILVDESVSQWGVVSDDPEADLVDVGCVTLSWRSDDDDAGELTVPEDQYMTTRKPLEEAS